MPAFPGQCCQCREFVDIQGYIVPAGFMQRSQRVTQLHVHVTYGDRAFQIRPALQAIEEFTQGMAQTDDITFAIVENQ